MIWNPKPGQQIHLRYRKSLRPETGLHGKTGTVITAATGPKTKNALVRTAGKCVVVPRGNLFAGERPQAKETPSHCAPCPKTKKPCDARQVDCPNAVMPRAKEE